MILSIINPKPYYDRFDDTMPVIARKKRLLLLFYPITRNQIYCYDAVSFYILIQMRLCACKIADIVHRVYKTR